MKKQEAKEMHKGEMYLTFNYHMKITTHFLEMQYT